MNAKCLVTKHHQTLFGDQTGWCWRVKTCLNKHRSNNWYKPLSKCGTHARMKHVWYTAVQTNKISPIKKGIERKVSSCLIECLMAFKFYPTRPNTIKQHQKRCPHSKIFGHQTMFDGVWSSNIFRLVRAYTVYESHTVWNKRKTNSTYQLIMF